MKCYVIALYTICNVVFILFLSLNLFVTIMYNFPLWKIPEVVISSTSWTFVGLSVPEILIWFCISQCNTKKISTILSGSVYHVTPRLPLCGVIHVILWAHDILGSNPGQPITCFQLYIIISNFIWVACVPVESPFAYICIYSIIRLKIVYNKDCIAFMKRTWTTQDIACAICK